MCIIIFNMLVFVVCIKMSINLRTSQSTIFLSTLPGFKQYCLAQGHNTVTVVGIELWTSRFGDRRSTTTPPHSPNEYN